MCSKLDTNLRWAHMCFVNFEIIWLVFFKNDLFFVKIRTYNKQLYPAIKLILPTYPCHKCCVLDCGTVATIQNGYANFTDKVTTFGGAVPIICNKGYRLHGPNIITCLPTGLWSRSTECIIKGTTLQ